MSHPKECLVVVFSVEKRALVRNVLAALCSSAGVDPVLRRGRITADGAWIEMELRAGREHLEAALKALEHPGVRVRSYGSPGASRVETDAKLPAAVGYPTLPPAASPRCRVAALAH